MLFYPSSLAVSFKISPNDRPEKGSPRREHDTGEDRRCVAVLDWTRSQRVRNPYDAQNESDADLPTDKNLRAVQLLLGHTNLESTVRYLGIEVDDALESQSRQRFKEQPTRGVAGGHKPAGSGPPSLCLFGSLPN